MIAALRPTLAFFVMALPVRALIILGLFFGVTAALVAEAQTPKEPANASVTGKVTIKGKPAEGIVVGMRLMQPNQNSPTFKATTNQDGIYRITNISRGNYEVAPVAPALTVSDAKTPRGQNVVITGDDVVEGIDFDLVRGGVITGKVTDASGRATIEMNVGLTVIELQNKVSGFDPPNAQTDDRGIYRLFGIPPGRYKVAVSDPRRYGRGGGPPALPITFYPSEPGADTAKPVEVEEGTVAENIDIRIGTPPPTFAVAGRVLDEAGNPVSNVYIGLAKIVVVNGNTTRREGVPFNVASDSQGKFRLTNVAAGKYELSLWGGEGSDVEAQATVNFEVLDADVSDLVIKTIKGTLVSGVVIMEGSKRPVSRLSVGVVTRNENNTGSSWAGSANVKPDGSFVMGRASPGTLVFSVTGWDNQGYRLTRIERDGVEQPNAIRLEAGQRLAGLRLYVTFSSGTISGVVKINGTLPAGGRVTVQVVRPDENRGITGADVDARGHFLFEGLAAGTYELLVMAFVPNSRQRPTITKQSVTVIDGTVTDITLNLDLTTSPNQ